MNFYQLVWWDAVCIVCYSSDVSPHRALDLQHSIAPQVPWCGVRWQKCNTTWALHTGPLHQCIVCTTTMYHHNASSYVPLYCIMSAWHWTFLLATVMHVGHSSCNISSPAPTVKYLQSYTNTALNFNPRQYAALFNRNWPEGNLECTI